MNIKPDAYAVIVPDNVWVPALRQGQTAFLTPGQKPRPEQPVFVACSDDSCARALFIRRTKDSAILRHLQPKIRDTAIPSTTITALIPIIALVDHR